MCSQHQTWSLPPWWLEVAHSSRKSLPSVYVVASTAITLGKTGSHRGILTNASDNLPWGESIVLGVGLGTGWGGKGGNGLGWELQSLPCFCRGYSRVCTVPPSPKPSASLSLLCPWRLPEGGEQEATSSGAGFSCPALWLSRSLRQSSLSKLCSCRTPCGTAL